MKNDPNDIRVTFRGRKFTLSVHRYVDGFRHLGLAVAEVAGFVKGKDKDEEWLEGSGLDKPLPDGKTDLRQLQEQAVEQLHEVLRKKANTQKARAKNRDLDMER